jgi:Domain of unknown function (DUF4375)
MGSELGGYLTLESDEDCAREVGYYVLRKMERCGFEDLSRAEQVIACLAEVEMEVNNGGFDQYYWNSSGDHAHEAVAALRELGATQTADLLVEANAVFEPPGPDRDRERRWAQMDRLAESQRSRWGDMDGTFYEYKDNLSLLAATYIRKNRRHFTD